MKLLFTLLFAGSGLLHAQSNLNLVADNMALGNSILSEGPSYRTSSSVPFRMVKNILLVEGSVDGQVGNFILDTGAPGLVLNEVTSEKEKSLQGTGIFNQVKLGLKKVLHFSFGNIQKSNVSGHTVNINHLSKALNTPISGLLGYEMFQGNCLFINQKEDYVDIFKKKKTVFELLGKPDYKIPFNLLGHLPVIKAKIGGMVVFCGIDTGSSIHLVDEELTKKYCLNKGAGNYEYVKGIGTENLVRKEIKIIPRLEAGNAVQWETDCVPANLSHLQEPTFNWKIEALLGMPFFKHYKYILIDYRSLNIFMWE